MMLVFQDSLQHRVSKVLCHEKHISGPYSLVGEEMILCREDSII